MAHPLHLQTLDVSHQGNNTPVNPRLTQKKTAHLQERKFSVRLDVINDCLFDRCHAVHQQQPGNQLPLTRICLGLADDQHTLAGLVGGRLQSIAE